MSVWQTISLIEQTHMFFYLAHKIWFDRIYTIFTVCNRIQRINNQMHIYKVHSYLKLVQNNTYPASDLSHMTRTKGVPTLSPPPPPPARCVTQFMSARRQHRSGLQQWLPVLKCLIMLPYRGEGRGWGGSYHSATL